MKLDLAMFTSRMARSRAEAQRLIKQGAVSVGGCVEDCTFFSTGKCTCGGWEKITKPNHEVPAGWCIKVGSGFMRTVKREGAQGFDQLRGVGKVPVQGDTAISVLRPDS